MPVRDVADAWGVEYYDGFGPIVIALRSVFKSVRHDAERVYDEWRRANADKKGK